MIEKNIYTTCVMPRVSWRAVLAGVVTAMAVSIVMGVLGVALGFAVVEPTAQHPLSGLGVAFGIWTMISALVSLGAGGLVSGFFSGEKGWEHGFLVWGTSLIAATFISTMVLTSAVSTLGAAGASAVSAAGSGAANVVSGVVDTLRENISLDINQDELSDDVIAVLRDTGVETLRPEYLAEQMREARSDLRRALNRMAVDPDNYSAIIDSFIQKQRARIDTVTSDVDRESAVVALMRNSNMGREEAETAVDNALRAWERFRNTAGQMLNEAQDQFEDTQAYLQHSAERMRLEADEMASTAATSSLFAALALILGAVVSAVAGRIGQRLAITYCGRA